MTSFDGYDENTEFEEPARHVRRDIEADLRDLLDIVANAKQMPLSNSALISRDEVMALLEQALHSLPDEIREARWALRDREELMTAEMQKAQQLMDQVRAEAARMVDKTEIVRQSRVKADQIIADAHAQARQMINQSEDFIDGKLGGFEIVLERLLKTARSGRERLNAQGLPTSLITENQPAEEFLAPAPPPAPTSGYDEPGVRGDSFFDQDSF
jgi:cell division septum initiation protein DivIVA